MGERLCAQIGRLRGEVTLVFSDEVEGDDTPCSSQVADELRAPT